MIEDVWNAKVWATLVRMDQKQLGFIELTPNGDMSEADHSKNEGAGGRSTRKTRGPAALSQRYAGLPRDLREASACVSMPLS